MNLYRQRKKLRWGISLIFALLLPSPAFAQSLITQIITRVGTTLSIVVALLLVLATVIFLWGMVLFIASSGNETKREKSKGIMTWGIIGFAVMAAAWGITTIIVNYFGVTGPAPQMNPPPEFKDLF